MNSRGADCSSEPCRDGENFQISRPNVFWKFLLTEMPKRDHVEVAGNPARVGRRENGNCQQERAQVKTSIRVMQPLPWLPGNGRHPIGEASSHRFHHPT
ncbi:hypothetical protein HNY73_015686 [Argiope bruennichi]|uniref:Uncharacterized protein n=1 Tax=Argiope bruennichi TaxID=94029 RepID=A0A8T0EGL4_ARGBR|nr:hypothetical protein HNY73_015686 [Argiope bruennichi]